MQTCPARKSHILAKAPAPRRVRARGLQVFGAWRSRPRGLTRRFAVERCGLGAIWAIAILSALGLLTGCHRRAEPLEAARLPAVPVRVETVQSKLHQATEEVIGTVRARLRAVLEAKVSGRIEKLAVSPGQAVQAGELLAQLDVRETQARLDQALALRQQAERDLKRFANLLEQHAVTQQEYDAVEARHRVAQAAVTEAETVLDYAKITAPFAGVITRKLADVGDLASPGRPLLELEDPSHLQLEVDVPETIIGQVKMGGRLPARAGSATNLLEATVAEMAPAADPNSRTFRVKLDLPPTAGLLAGQFARVAVPMSESAALRVPASALCVRGQMEMVFVVTNRAGQMQAQLRLVRTGKRIGGEIELLAGVEAGEQVVVEDAKNLTDGQPVARR